MPTHLIPESISWIPGTSLGVGKRQTDKFAQGKRGNFKVVLNFIKNYVLGNIYWLYRLKTEKIPVSFITDLQERNIAPFVAIALY